MLADDVREALPFLRAQALSLMVDVCTIRRGGDSVFDEETGRHSTSGGTVVYQGPCEVVTEGRGALDTDVASLAAVIASPALHIPWDAPAVHVGDQVTVVSTDPQIGKPMTVASVRLRSTQVKRRIVLEALQ